MQLHLGIDPPTQLGIDPPLRHNESTMVASTHLSAPTLASILNEWFTTHGRDIAWRHPGTSAWGILVSEVMSQQTPVRRVEPFWQAWMLRWPQPADLAAAQTAEVIRAWANLGYPRRALRLQECAQMCVEKYEGRVPSSIQELEALPAIGTYTARAVAAFAFGQAVPVVDTNVRRVYTRLVKGEFLQGSARAADLQNIAELLPYVDKDPRVRAMHLPAGDPALKESANRMCVALMELGAVICTATNPSCQQCPLAQQCLWVRKGKPQPSEDAQAAAKARVQKFAGTDRQVRGKIMAQLRSKEYISRKELDLLWPDAQQLQRCVDSLLVDKLLVHEQRGGGSVLRLPS